MKKTIFHNARIITSTGITHGELLVEGNKIEKIAFNGEITESADERIDVEGNYLSPGFIDIHTHGAGGADFMDGSLESIYTACMMHLKHGTTSIVPTTLTGSREGLLDFITLFNKVQPDKEGCPNILGLHLEGPYFSPVQAGSQDPRHLRNPEPTEYNAVLAKTDRIKRWSFAIELEGSDAFLNTLRTHGIVTSLAHSEATCIQVQRAYEKGLAALTHFYSAMSGVKRINAYRVAGAIEAGYLLDDLYVEVIADGKHLPAELLQLIYKVKGSSHICLVSDSMRAAGMSDGEYILGSRSTGVPCIVEDDVAKLPDRTAFAGSTATDDRLVRTFRNLTGAPLHDVVKMITLNPAKLLKIDAKKGSIAEGKDADLIVFDDTVNIKQVMVMGKKVR